MFLIGLVVCHFLVGHPRSLRACPMCAEAVPETSIVDEDDRVREAQAYNWCIYLMVSMPYLLLGGVGCLVYRGLKQRVQAGERHSVSVPVPTNGQPIGDRRPECSLPSLVEHS
jgi:hypothetical protein